MHATSDERVQNRAEHRVEGHLALVPRRVATPETPERAAKESRPRGRRRRRERRPPNARGVRDVRDADGPGPAAAAASARLERRPRSLPGDDGRPRCRTQPPRHPQDRRRARHARRVRRSSRRVRGEHERGRGRRRRGDAGGGRGEIVEHADGTGETAGGWREGGDGSATRAAGRRGVAGAIMRSFRRFRETRDGVRGGGRRATGRRARAPYRFRDARGRVLIAVATESHDARTVDAVRRTRRGARDE